MVGAEGTARQGMTAAELTKCRAVQRGVRICGVEATFRKRWGLTVFNLSIPVCVSRGDKADGTCFGVPSPNGASTPYFEYRRLHAPGRVASLDTCLTKKARSPTPQRT